MEKVLSMSKNFIKVAITGPESTGKSTLAQLLAKEYNTVFNPEYAREYIDNLSIPYSYQDVERIAIEQLLREKHIRAKGKQNTFCRYRAYCHKNMARTCLWQNTRLA